MLARACGFAAGGSIFTAALLLASRPMGLGPGFSDPLPYAAAAILICVSGHAIRRWLHEPLPLADTAAPGTLRRLGREALQGLRVFLKGPASFNNFVLLSLVYFLGIGLSSLFFRGKGPAKTGMDGTISTYWRDLDRGKRDADAYYRPF
jgi:hypothetical protein